MYRRKGLDCWQALGWKAAQRARVMIDHESRSKRCESCVEPFSVSIRKEHRAAFSQKKMLGPPKKLVKTKTTKTIPKAFFKKPCYFFWSCHSQRLKALLRLVGKTEKAGGFSIPGEIISGSGSFCFAFA